MPAADPRKSNYEAAKLAKRLRHQVGRAIADFNMIADGDKVMVCLSGGKDSYTLLDVLLMLRAKAPVDFAIGVVHLDQKQPGYDPDILPRYLAAKGVAYTILEQDTYSVVKRVVPAGKTQCGLCSRLRRGALYAHAKAHGYTRIALGHHRDDIVQTFFLNLFYHAKLAAMPAKLMSDDGQHVVIRPLAYVAERDIVRWADIQGYPIIPCNLCGSQENLQRKAIKQLLLDWEARQPGRIDTIFRALADVRPSQLADPKLFDFIALGARGRDAAGVSAWLGGEPTERQPPPVLSAAVPTGLEILGA